MGKFDQDESQNLIFYARYMCIGIENQKLCASTDNFLLLQNLWYTVNSFFYLSSFEELYAPVPTPLTPTFQQLPCCVDIIELPLSMSALNHLEGVAMRHTHNQPNELAAEKGLLKVSDIDKYKILRTNLKFLKND